MSPLFGAAALDGLFEPGYNFATIFLCSQVFHGDINCARQAGGHYMISLATLNEAYLHSHFVHAGMSGNYNQGRNGNFWTDMLNIN